MNRTLAILCVGIIALDAVESLVTRTTGVSYAWFTLVQILVYLGIGFALRRRRRSLREALIALIAVAFVEATVGQWVSIALGAAPAIPLAAAAIAAPFVVVLSTLVGLAGFALAFRTRAAGQ